MNNQTNFTIMQILRTALRLCELDEALENGVDFEDAYPATMDYVDCLDDEDVTIAMRDRLDELQKWASDCHANN